MAYTKDNLNELMAYHYGCVMNGATTHKAQGYAGNIATDLPRARAGGREYVPRGVRLAEGAFSSHDCTLGCPGCAWLQDKIGPKHRHSKQCRERMLKELQGTEEGRASLTNAQERYDFYCNLRGPQEDEPNTDANLPQDTAAKGHEDERNMWWHRMVSNATGKRWRQCHGAYQQ